MLKHLLLCVVLCLHALSPLASEEKSATAAYIAITGEIDDWQASYVASAVEEAVEKKVDYIVTYIDSYGGHVVAANLIFNAFINLDGPDQPRCIAFIDEKAISAGALIAYSHHEIYMTSTVSIGDIGVIFMNREGAIEYAPEKMVSPIRNQLALASAKRGWDAAWLQKMTDRNEKLYKIRHNDGKELYVIEEKLPQYLADHPDIDKNNEQQVILTLGEDRLVTQHAHKAVELGIATEVVNNIDDVFQKLNINTQSVHDLSPNSTKVFSKYLAESGWAPILLGLTVMFVIFELKAPGIGIFGGLALLSGTLYFLCQYHQDLLNIYEVLLILAGLLIITLEFFTMIGGGLLGLFGAALASFGIFLTFMPEHNQFDFEDPYYTEYLSAAMFNSLITFFTMGIGVVLLFIAAPRIPALQRLSVKASIEGTSEGQAAIDKNAFIGEQATCITPLRPSGQIQLADDSTHSATVLHGQFIDSGTPVIIKEQRFGDFIVEPLEASENSEKGSA